MNSINNLRFAVSDNIENVDVSPSHVPLSLLDFPKDVGEFLKGSTHDIDSNKTFVSIENSSLAVAVSSALLVASATLWHDFEQLRQPDSLSAIDPKRAKIIEHWQSMARKNPHRRYSVVDTSSRTSFLSIDSTSNFYRTDDVWVKVEKYLFGKVFDMGGKNKANVHLELDDGSVLKISATQQLIEQMEQNRLHRPALLHVEAEEHLLNGKLRNYRLVEFADYQPSYDEAEFNLMVERGTKAWADVADPSQWLEELRGNVA
ncbi:MAG: hypothetical protein WCK96_10500 [Methylococcales bacterium]